MADGLNVVIAPDSYKGSISSDGAASAMRRGVLAVCPDANVTCIPIADGGEGFVDAMLTACGGEKIFAPASDPFGVRIQGFYGLLPDKTAVIELAVASGLGLVPRARRNPLHTTTLGTGELILAAARGGCRRMIIGIGGSATNDGGMGIMRALGVRFYDSFGFELPCCGMSLSKVARIDCSAMEPSIRDMDIVVASDVDNPLCGSDGAAAVYGPQKGADYEMIYQLDEGLASYARVLLRDLGADIADIPGAGAAGGVGAALMAFLGARLMPGIEVMMEMSRAKSAISAADIVLTGEGRTDRQTARGKAPMGITSYAKVFGVPVVLISGSLGEGYEALYDLGVTAAFAAINSPMDLEQAMANPAPRITAAAEAALRLFLAGRGR